MKLNVLKNALVLYMLSADCPSDERADAVSAFAELERLTERFSDRDLWKDDVQVLTTNDVMTLLNVATYDMYGKLAAKGCFEFHVYEHTVREQLDVDLTRESLRCGFDLVKDLWFDNQEAGCNNPDGTFAFEEPANGKV